MNIGFFPFLGLQNLQHIRGFDSTLYEHIFLAIKLSFILWLQLIVRIL